MLPHKIKINPAHLIYFRPMIMCIPSDQSSHMETICNAKVKVMTITHCNMFPWNLCEPTKFSFRFNKLFFQTIQLTLQLAIHLSFNLLRLNQLSIGSLHRPYNIQRAKAYLCFRPLLPPPGWAGRCYTVVILSPFVVLVRILYVILQLHSGRRLLLHHSRHGPLSWCWQVWAEVRGWGWWLGGVVRSDLFDQEVLVHAQERVVVL